MIIGIDPGNTHSASAIIQDGRIVTKCYRPNADFIKDLGAATALPGFKGHIVCEMIASYGMPVGKTVFDTCVFIGQLLQVFPAMKRVTRVQVKSTICHSAKAKDGNIRQALIDIYGPPGTKSTPGGTYGLSGDMWAALAVATAFANGCTLYPETQLPA